MKIFYESDAIRSLIGGIAPDDGQTRPSEEEIEAEILRLEAEWTANQYQRDRKYPELGEQLDMLFHDMTTNKGTKDCEWYKTIAKVKSDNPK